MAKIFRSTDDDKPVTVSNSNPRESLNPASAASPRQERELAHRDNDGLHVTLLWHPVTDELVVRVWDRRQAAQFEVRAEPDIALEVYNHPYAYLGTTDEVLAT